MWLRAFLVCDDIRLEAGGTVSLIGVYADTILVPPGDGEIVLPRLATYTVVAGLVETAEIRWRQWLSADGAERGAPVAEGRDPHDALADEHRIVSILSPLALPGAGRFQLALEIETRRARRLVDHYVTIERLPASA